MSTVTDVYGEDFFNLGYEKTKFMAGIFNIQFSDILIDPETRQEYTMDDIEQILDVTINEYGFAEGKSDAKQVSGMHICTKLDLETFFKDST